MPRRFLGCRDCDYCEPAAICDPAASVAAGQTDEDADLFALWRAWNDLQRWPGAGAEPDSYVGNCPLAARRET